MLPFARFAGADSVLGPEMKSTGEVMGIAADFPTAFGKAQAAAGVRLPEEGSVFITVTDTDKPAATQLAARFHDLGFEVIATGGTAQAIERMGVPVTRINKMAEGSPHVVDLIRERRCDLVINTPTGSGARADGYEIRTAAVRHGIPCVTTMTGATAAARAIAAGKQDDAEVRSIQEIHGARQGRAASMTAPFGRRLCEVTENRASGGYRVFSLLDREGPEPLPGQFYMLASEPAGGRRRRAALPAAGDLRRRDRPGGRRRAPGLPGRGHRARHRPALRAGAGRGGLGHRPARQRVLGAPRAAAGRRRGDSRRRRHRHRAAGAAAPPLRRAQRPRPGPARLSRQSHSGGLDDLFACCEVRLASEDGHAGHRGYVTDLLAAMLGGDDADSAVVYSCGPPAMLEAVRLLCAERGRRLRAGPGVADGLRLRRLLRLRRAEAGGRLPAPLRRRPGGAGGAGRRGHPCLSSAGSTSRTR